MFCSKAELNSSSFLQLAQTCIRQRKDSVSTPGLNAHCRIPLEPVPIEPHNAQGILAILS
jgi:hypothetical protein